MKNSVLEILRNYGFETKDLNLFYWGYGCVAWGSECYIYKVGNLYIVTIHKWFWDGGDVEIDGENTRSLHAGEALEWIFEELKDLWR